MYKKLYLLFALANSVLLAMAQSPGGYGTGVKLWIKSDAASTISATGGLIDSWTYVNDGTKTFTATTTARPALTANGLNFNATATFSGAQMMEGPNGVNAPLAASNPDYCMFAVWRSTTTGAFQRVWAQRHLSPANDGSGFGLATWNDGRYGDQLEQNPFDQGMLLTHTASKWNISHLNILSGASNDIEARNQLSVTGAAAVGSSGGKILVDNLNRLGSRDAPGDESLSGDIAEVVVYDDPIASATVRNQIFSYLAFKWGINKAGDYIGSDGTTTFWSATTNTGYNNAVFGIGLDNGSGLSVTQSNSAETGNGQTGTGNLVLFNASSLSTDLNFLAIGNDAGALTETSTNLPTLATGAQRLVRQWKVQHTGNVGTVSLDIDLSSLTISGSLGTASDFRLMIDPDGDGDFTNNTVSYVAPSGFTGSVVHFTGVTLPNSATFALITKTTATMLPVTWKSFTARAAGSDVILHWEVESNEQAKTYEVEHSTNGLDFAKIGSVANIATVKSYSFTHTNVAGGKHYYRLHQVDFDGKAVYSNVADVTLKQSSLSIRLLSNPVQNNSAEIEVNSLSSARASIELWSLNGLRITTLQQGIGAGNNILYVPLGNVAKGNYLLKVKVNDTVQLLQVSKL